MLQMQLTDATTQVDPQVNVIENAKILASSFEQIETAIMKRGGTNSLTDQGADPLAHFVCRIPGVSERENLIGTGMSGLDQVCDALHQN
jgi:hypothetical protein